MLQLDPPIPLDTPRGPGFAYMVIDYSQDHKLLYSVFLTETGENWIFPQDVIRIQKNMSLGVRQDKVEAASTNGPKLYLIP
jgi:hypothetical protein